MSSLADSIIKHGPYKLGKAVPAPVMRFLAVPDLNALRDELIETRALFDLEWTRMGEATERWRAEDPEARALIMPDLGALLKWLMDDADRARADSTPSPAGGRRMTREEHLQAIKIVGSEQRHKRLGLLLLCSGPDCAGASMFADGRNAAAVATASNAHIDEAEATTPKEV
jgi:hypothetical protein